MRKGLFFLCLVLYAFSVALTVFVQHIGIQDRLLKIVCTLGILLSFFAVLAMLFLAFRLKGGVESLEQKENPAEKIPSKEKYLEFAARSGLSRRETEIGWLVLNGLSNIQLAETLYISLATVKKHLTHIYEKTETSGRKEFAEKAGKF
ncbi:helix-turn-helix transcriptional regulator [uncultured Treponema sp.]|uniref:helix-turn-helix transcriptional regulator n=1 Tax=uncultured Treponema sp. TaxID=162155 RepID=UPI0025DD533F|nr:helix-turn-helix transcriptional regulator [uncultured Treponema sp.]